jgi:hypothetical protein
MGGKTTTTNSNSTATANTNSANQSFGSTTSGGTSASNSNNTTGASAAAMPYINNALGMLNDAQGVSSGLYSGLQGSLADIIGGIPASMQANSKILSDGLSTITGYANGQGLQNPYFQQELDAASNNARDNAFAASSARGIAGGSQAAELVARTIFDAQAPLLSQNWRDQLNARIQAASMVPGYVSAQGDVTSGGLNDLIQAITLPYATTSPYVSGIGSLLGNWTSSTGSQTGTQTGYGTSQETGTSMSNTTGSETGYSQSKESGGGVLGGLLGLASLAVPFIKK